MYTNQCYIYLIYSGLVINFVLELLFFNNSDPGNVNGVAVLDLWRQPDAFLAYVQTAGM
ncbi:MAG: hypothetical protein WD037_10025 [Balneolales bacterium]